MNRDLKGKYARRWYKSPLFWVAVVFISIPVIGQIPAVDHYQFTADWFYNEVHYVAPVAEAAEIAPDKIEEMKWEVIDRLQACESGGHTWEEGFIKMDTNNKLSYSPMQWQMDTAKYYAHKRDGSKLIGKAALDLMMNEKSSRQLAYDVIFVMDVAPSKDWYICSEKHGLDMLVEFINKYE